MLFIYTFNIGDEEFKFLYRNFWNTHADNADTAYHGFPLLLESERKASHDAFFPIFTEPLTRPEIIRGLGCMKTARAVHFVRSGMLFRKRTFAGFRSVRARPKSHEKL